MEIGAPTYIVGDAAAVGTLLSGVLSGAFVGVSAAAVIVASAVGVTLPEATALTVGDVVTLGDGLEVGDKSGLGVFVSVNVTVMVISGVAVSVCGRLVGGILVVGVAVTVVEGEALVVGEIVTVVVGEVLGEGQTYPQLVSWFSMAWSHEQLLIRSRHRQLSILAFSHSILHGADVAHGGQEFELGIAATAVISELPELG